jgi:YD repeat-containing protein
MDKLHNRSCAFIALVITLTFACGTKNETVNSLLPPWRCDPFSQVFWNRNIMYFTNKNTVDKDTTFFDQAGNIVREVQDGRQTGRWAYDLHRNLIHGWTVHEEGRKRNVTNIIFRYEIIDSTAIIQKCISLKTDNWNYMPGDEGSSRLEIYLLEEGNRVVEKFDALHHNNNYFYHDTLLIREEYLDCSSFEIQTTYEYADSHLKKISKAFGWEKKAYRVDFLESGLLDSTQYTDENGVKTTDVYKYAFY